jgi:hypothetical protein
MWLTDKLFGGKKAPEPLHLRVYGKLPFYQDFLGIRTDGPASSLFREWLDRGFAGTYEMGGREAGPMVARPQRMLFLPDGVRTAVAAVIFDSHDRNRLREFPIAFFVEVAALELAAEGLGPASLMEHVWAELAAVRDEAADCASAPEFYRRFGTTVLTRRSELDGAREHLAGEWRRAGLGEWAASLAGGRRRGGAEIVQSVLQTLRDDAQAALRIPLSPLLSFPAQADLWALSTGRVGSMWFPLDDGAAGADLYLSLRRPRPWDARLFRGAPAGAAGEGGWLDAREIAAECAGRLRGAGVAVDAEPETGGRPVGDLRRLASL